MEALNRQKGSMTKFKNRIGRRGVAWRGVAWRGVACHDMESTRYLSQDRDQ